jgi:CelD/BcsL family acetyltransferase involved in cellulose biosynthesis
MLCSEIIRDCAQFDALAPQWWNLWYHTPTATPFQCPGWLLPWWSIFAPGELATIAVWRGDELVGLAPLYLERAAARLKLLPVGISLSDYLDVLCVPGQEGPVAAAIAEQILSFDWSQWIMPDLPGGGAGLAIAHPRLGAADPVSHMACPVLELRGDETLANSVPQRRRRQLRRAHRFASRRGLVALSSPDDLQLFLDQLFRLHANRWARHGGGVLADVAVEQFHRRSLPQLDARGLSRCWLLTIDGRAVGAYYGFHHRDRAYAYLGGFDPAYAEESPGTILIGHAISESIREGAVEFDFLRGQEPYKYGWGAVDRWTLRRVWTRR